MPFGKGSRNQKANSVYKPIVPTVEQASRILICLGKSSKFKMSLKDISLNILSPRPSKRQPIAPPQTPKDQFSLQEAPTFSST